MPILRLECIGDHFVALFQRGDKEQQMYAMFRAGGFPKSPTVHEILSWHRNDGFLLNRLRGRRNYENANSIGSRGIYLVFELHEGRFYRKTYPTSWRKWTEEIVTVVDGKINPVCQKETLKCLRARGLAYP